MKEALDDPSTRNAASVPDPQADSNMSVSVGFTYTSGKMSPSALNPIYPMASYVVVFSITLGYMRLKTPFSYLAHF